MKTKLSFILGGILLLTGCQSKVWYQSGKSRAQIQKDWATSQLMGQRAKLHIPQPLIFSDSDFAAGLAIGAQRDARNAARKIERLTMESKGYQLVPKHSVPANEPFLKP